MQKNNRAKDGVKVNNGGITATFLLLNKTSRRRFPMSPGEFPQ